MLRRFRSVPMLALAYGIAALSALLLNVCVGRGAGAAALGDFALAVATARIFYAGVDLGLAAHLTRTLSRDTSQSARYIAMFVGFRVCMIPLAIVSCVATATLLGRTDMWMFAFVATAQGIVAIQGLYESLVLAHERQSAVAVLTVSSAVCVMTGAVTWLGTGGSLALFAGYYALASTLGIVVWIAWSARRLRVPTRLEAPGAAVWNEIGRSWPIGASMLLGIAALRAPLLVLAAYASREDVGAFSAVDMIVTASAILQAALSSATFPRLAASFATDPPRFRRLFLGSNAALLAIGLAIAVFLALAGAPLLSIIFPSRDFAQIDALMPIVAWSTPALLLVHHNVYLFAAAHRENLNVRVMTVWLVATAAFQLAIVPAYGVVGAAWALVIARVVGIGALAAVVIAAQLHRGDARAS